MPQRRTNPEFLNGVPELMVLKLLSVRPMYGYELVEAIKRETKGTLAFGEGCIYSLLHLLENKKILSSERKKVHGRSRVIYEVTPKGRKRLQESTDRWLEVVHAVNTVLGEDSNGIAVV